jgi:hypothetical protein
MSVVNFPVWRQDAETWHLLVGNESVAQLRFDIGDPERPWLATFRDFGRRNYRIDFVLLDQAKAALEMWWHLTQRPPKPDVKRFLGESARYRISQNWADRKWLQANGS